MGSGKAPVGSRMAPMGSIIAPVGSRITLVGSRTALVLPECRLWAPEQRLWPAEQRLRAPGPGPGSADHFDPMVFCAFRTSCRVKRVVLSETLLFQCVTYYIAYRNYKSCLSRLQKIPDWHLLRFHISPCRYFDPMGNFACSKHFVV